MTTRVLQLIKSYQRVELLKLFEELDVDNADKALLSRAFTHGCHVTEAKGEICPICKETVSTGNLAQHVAACFHRFDEDLKGIRK